MTWGPPGLDIQIVHFEGVLLDERSSRFDIRPHQDGEDPVINKRPGANSVNNLIVKEIGPDSFHTVWEKYEDDISVSFSRVSLALKNNQDVQWLAYYECWPSSIRGISTDPTAEAVINEVRFTCNEMQ